MPDYARRAAAHRDSKLRTIRRLSLWISGGAAAASLGLGTAFAHALPGHSYPAAQQENPPGADPASRMSRPPTGRVPGQAGDRHRHGDRDRSRTQQLAPPRQPPAQAAAPPAVSSGGS